MKTIILVMLFITQNAWPQQIGLSIGSGEVEKEDVQSIAFDYSKDFYKTNFFSNNFILGYGFRYTNLTSDSFEINSKGNEVLTDLASQSYNLALYTTYDLVFFALGFNIDLLGYTHGRKTEISSSATKVRPVKFNLLLGGEADLGTLNSEFWIGKKLGMLWLKLGMSHIVTEYEDTGITTGKRQKFFDTYFINLAYNWN